LKVEAKFAGGESKWVQVVEGITIVDLLRELGVNRETVLVRLDGKVVPEEQPLRDGDRVDIFQVVTGG
jgi:sulfur carrier protein